MLRIGAHKNTDFAIQSSAPLVWTNEEINVLGILVSQDEQTALKNNYNLLCKKSAAILKKWNKRNLTILGKVNIVNTLISSLFIYKMMVLPKIPGNVLKTMNKLISEFIWNKGVPKVSRIQLENTKPLGGVKLVSLAKRDMAIKITWIQILQKDVKMAALAYHFLSNTLKNDI